MSLTCETLTWPASSGAWIARAQHEWDENLLDRIHALGARIRMFQPEAFDTEALFLKLTEGKTQ